MTTQEQYIARLKELVEARYGSSITTQEECDALAAAVTEATGVKFDGRAYAPLFLSSNRGMAPRPVILSALARYIGMGSWSDFCASRNVLPADDTDIIPVTRPWGVVILTSIAIVVVIAAAILLLRSSNETIERRQHHIVAVVSSIEEQWVASTIEECNAIRTYNNSDEYDNIIATFVEEHSLTLKEDIATDLRTAFATEGIEVSSIELDRAIEQIAMRCTTLCNTLSYEMELAQQRAQEAAAQEVTTTEETVIEDL